MRATPPRNRQQSAEALLCALQQNRQSPWHILYQNSNVTNATAKFLRERVERFLDYLDEMFALHPSPTEIHRATLTLSSRR